MPADNKLELVIQVDADKGNAAIKSVNKNLNDLEKTAVSSAKGASQGIDGMTASMAKAVVVGNAIYDVAKEAFKAIKEFTLGAIETADILGKTAQKVGLTVEQVSALRYIAQIADVPLETLNRTVGMLSKNMLLAAQGSSEQKKSFAALGISFQNTDGTLRSVDSVLADLADRFKAMPDGTAKTGLALTILGRGGKELIPLLNQGGAGLRAMTEEARALGEVIDEKTFRAAEAFNDNLKRLKSAVEGLAFKVAQELLPKLIEFTDEMVRFVKGVDLGKLASELRDVAEAIKYLAIGIVSYSVAAKLLEVGKALAALRLAAIAGAGLNPATLLPALIAGGILVLYHEKEKLDAMNESFAEMNKQTRIMGELRKGKTLAELTGMGFSEDEIRKALGGGRNIGGEFHLGEKLAVPRIQSEEELKLAEQIHKAQGSAVRSSREFLLSAQEAAVTGPAKAVLEVQKEIEKLTTLVDEKGMEHRFQLLAEARENIEKALHVKIRAMEIESLEVSQKRMKEDADLRIRLMSEAYQRRLQLETDLDLKARENYEKLISFQEEQAGFARDAQLRQLEATDAQTLAQKVAVEGRKAEIEVQYIERVHAIKTKLFDLETDRELAAARLSMELVGLRADEIERRLADIQSQRDQIKATISEQDNAAIQAARENAANRQVQIARDHYRQIFDSLKQQAGGVFDALLTRSRSVFGAIGDALKTAVLTAIKDIVTSRVAAMLLQLFTGARVSFAGAGGGVQIAGGGRGLLGSLAGILGVGAVPVFGAGSITGGPGGTGGFAGPVSLGNLGGGSSVGSAFGLGRLAGFLPGLKSFFGIGGSIQTGAGTATTWAAANLGQKLSAIGHSNAAALAGIGLFLGGMQRGGVSGLAMTTAGGALTGFKYGGPVGAAIGAGVGFVAGLFGLFRESPEDKARKKIRQTYGVEIRDKGVLRQIVEMAKQGFGGNLDMAIRTPQVRDLIELYAMTTGQIASGLPAKMSAVSLVQTGGSLFQQPGFSNGSPLASFGGALPSIGLDRIGAGSPANAGPMVINITVPGAKEFFEKETVRVVVENPRAVQSAALSATKANAGRRELTSLQLSPGTLTS